jgi:tetratricopeptide (TPR) repeat protein
VKSSIGIILLLCLPWSVQSQQPVPSWLSDTDRARCEALRKSGIEALYDLDYEKAGREFKEIAKLFPNHSTGPRLLAARLLLKTLYDLRRLQTSLYSSSDSFYTRGDDKVDPRIVNEFRTLTREAKRLAEARLKVSPKDIEALDALGAIAGLKASFEEAVERRHFAAIRDGSEAVDRYREVLNLDPNYVDAGLTIGLYDYVIGALPLPKKILAGIAGHRGSKKRGLATLERVAKEGRWSNDDAKSVLILLYSREKRFADALTLARELSAKYPRNYLYRLETADALVALAAQERKAGNVASAIKAEQEAFRTFDEFLHNRSTRDALSRAQDLLHFKYGEVLLTAGEGERAAAEFIAATKVPGGEPSMITMAHLYAARALDISGKRNEAISHYRLVLSRPDIFDAHDGAKKGLQEPYRIETRQALHKGDESVQQN